MHYFALFHKFEEKERKNRESPLEKKDKVRGFSYLKYYYILKVEKNVFLPKLLKNLIV